MPRPIAVAFLALTACSAEPQVEAPRLAASESIAGLYERVAPGDAVDRICLTGEGRDARFGLVTWGEGAANCTARGSASVRSTSVSLRLDGAPACRLSATKMATGLTLEAAEGAECAYYCGAGAKFTPGAFTRVGATPSDIRQTTDLAGDRLC